MRNSRWRVSEIRPYLRRASKEGVSSRRGGHATCFQLNENSTAGAGDGTQRHTTVSWLGEILASISGPQPLWVDGRRCTGKLFRVASALGKQNDTPPTNRSGISRDHVSIASSSWLRRPGMTMHPVNRCCGSHNAVKVVHSSAAKMMTIVCSSDYPIAHHPTFASVGRRCVRLGCWISPCVLVAVGQSCAWRCLSIAAERIKLGDFGVAKLVEAATLKAQTLVGSCLRRASGPEYCYHIIGSTSEWRMQALVAATYQARHMSPQDCWGAPASSSQRGCWQVVR